MLPNGFPCSPSGHRHPCFFLKRSMLNKSTSNCISIPFGQWNDRDDNVQADVDRFVDDGSLDDNVESFLAHDDGDPRDAVGRNVDGNKGTISLFLFLFVNIWRY